MEISVIAQILQTVIIELPGAIKTVQQLTDLGAKFYSVVNGKPPTTEEIAQLEASLDADILQSLEPLPAPIEGDPDYVKTVA